MRTCYTNLHPISESYKQPIIRKRQRLQYNNPMRIFPDFCPISSFIYYFKVMVFTDHILFGFHIKLHFKNAI